MPFVYVETLISPCNNTMSKEVFSVLATFQAKCHYKTNIFREGYCLLFITVANSS